MSSKKSNESKVDPVMVALAALLVAAFMTAQAATIQCPRSIIEKPVVASSPAGWAVVALSGERQLDRAEIYLGIGSEYGAQVPDGITRVKQEEHVRWKIQSAAAEKFWIGCSYLGTTAILVLKLKPTVESCVATYTLLKNGKRQRLKTIDCR